MKIQTDAPAVAAASAPQEGDWDEEQLQTALRKLKELHIKVGTGLSTSTPPCAPVESV